MKGIRFAIAAVVIVALFHFLPFLDSAEAALTRAFLGTVGSVRGVAIAVISVPGSFRDADELRRENERLVEERRLLEEQVGRLTGIEEENSALRSLITLKERDDLIVIPANVVGSDPDASTHAIIIDRGTESGIVRGDAVVYGEGILIGKAERVSAGRTTVLLTVDRKSAVAAMVRERPEANGVALGERGLTVNLTLIPQNAEVVPGDQVITTGLEPLVPRALLIGTVESVTRTPSDPFASATVVPAFDVLRLTTVAVVHKRP